MITLSGGQVETTSVISPCQHGPDDFQGLIVQDEELIAVACRLCNYIKLIDPGTGETTTAYMGKHHPLKMCLGGPDKLWLWGYNEDACPAFELNCSSRKFTPTGRTLDVNMECWEMCCLPPPHDCLALGNFSVRAVSCKTGSVMWEIKGEVDGKKINPCCSTCSTRFWLWLILPTNVYWCCTLWMVQSSKLLGFQKMWGIHVS